MFLRSCLMMVSLAGAMSASAVELFWVGESQPQQFDTRMLSAKGFGAAVVHNGGRLTSDASWSANAVHIVYGTVVVETNVTLTIQAGAVVQFAGGGIYARGDCIANGVHFADVASDEVVSYVLKGNVVTDETATFRGRNYQDGTPQCGASDVFPFNTRGYGVADLAGAVTHEGAVTSDETWSADETHVVYGTLYVAADVTLTIEPGAVVKFVGGGLVVDGRCVARGVTFTDLDDDSHGATRANAKLPEASYVLEGGIETDDATVMMCSKGNQNDLADPGVSRVFRLETDLERVRFAGVPCEVTFSTAWDGSTAVEVTETRPDGSTVVLTNGTADCAGVFLWDAGETPGLYTLRHVTDTNELSASFYRLFNATVHDRLDAGTNVWEAGVVHVVDRGLVLMSGSSLLIEPGTVVKFFPGSGLAVEAGGVCTARDVIFTSVHDVTVGGDTLGDGGAALPGEEDYLIVGYIRDSAATEYRFGTHSLSGTLSGDETWEANRVYVIDGTLTVAAGASLTIASGAVVKFTSGSTLAIESGATCSAEGVIFTHIADDTAGGDTMGDGAETAPEVGAYTISGPILDDETTQYRYSAPVVTSGTISKSTFWRSRNVYRVTGNLTVASGATLTIMPGAIVKFDDGKSLTVNSGATLNAIGTRAQPIVFTSVKDDTVGGDTNGDGDKTRPEGGNWTGLYVYGAANLDYCYAMYAAPSNERGNIECRSGGRLTMNGCTVAHSRFDGVWNWGGTIKITNSIFFDCGNAVCPYQGSTECDNCVMFECNYGYMDWSHWVGGAFMNCIFYGMGTNWSDTDSAAEFQTHSVVKNCCFYNPEGYSKQSCTKNGVDGNIWGDPKFVDPDNGDFRIAADSPCVDAGDGTVAPQTDWYGQPRTTHPLARQTGKPDAKGEYADIGIHEVQPRNVKSDVDLAVVRVSTPERLVVGEDVTVSWTVRNEGSQDAVGSWSDRIEIVCANGSTVVLGTKTVAGGLVAGGERMFTGTWHVQSAQVGPARVRVTANAEREVFEGSLTANNAALSDGVCEVELPELVALGADGSAQVPVGARSETAFRLPSAVSADGGLLVVRAPAGVSVWTGAGQVPTADIFFAGAVKVADDIWLVRIPETGDAFVTVRNDGGASASVELSVETGAFQLFDTGVVTAPNEGVVTLTLFGNGFAEDMSVELAGNGRQVPALGLTVEDAVKASASFDVSGLPAGAYRIRLARGGEEVSGVALELTEQRIGPKWRGKLEISSLVRSGRVYSGAFAYGNDGDVALAAPYVVLKAAANTLIRFSEADAWGDTLEFMATSGAAPASLLKPGEQRRVTFFYKTTGSSVSVTATVNHESAEAFPWETNGGYMRPSWATDEIWGHALATLKRNVGATWNDYIARMRANCDHLQKIGAPTHRLDRIWQLEVNEALGVDHAVSSLAGGTDLARSGRGMGLALRRSYGASLFSRFRKGPFGYGWSDNYSFWAELQDSGSTLALHSGDGSTYRFGKTNGAWTPEDARDKTTVSETADEYVLTYRSGMVQRIAKANMRVMSIADNQGNEIAFAYGDGGLGATARPVRVEHTDGQTLTFAYDGDRLVSVTDDQGRVVRYAYDGDLLAAVTAFNGLVTRYNYYPADSTLTSRALRQIVYPDGNTKDFTYDAAGRVATAAVNGDLMMTEIVRGEFGSYRTIAPNGGVSSVTVGVSGEVLETVNALGQKVTRTYTDDTLLESMIGPTGKRSKIAYDADGNAVKATDAAGATTSFAYTEDFGALARVTDARGNSFDYGYDRLGRSERIGYADDSLERVVYSNRGDITNSVNRRGQSVAYTYDREGNALSEVWETGRTLTWEYDAKGNCTKATDSETGAVTMEYDANERLTRIAYPGGRGFTYVYDALGRVTARTSFDGFAQKYEYDALGRLKKLTDGEGNPYLENVYDETTGLLWLMKYGNGTIVSNSYDVLGRTVGIYHYAKDGSEMERFVYEYDAEGRRISQTTAEGVERYTYDTVGQLTDVTYPDGTEEHFRYDAVGNRLSANGDAYTVNALNQYTSVGSAHRADRTSFEYDLDGNMTKRIDSNGTTTYTYDIQNRLVAVTNETKDIRWACVYDVFGNRVKVIDHGAVTEKVFVQGSLPSVAEEYSGATLKVRKIGMGSTSFAAIEGGSVSYSHEDGRMSTCAVSDADGKVKSRGSVKAFGEARIGDDHNFVDMLGVEYDEATGLYFMRNRYYDAGLGRFVQCDPIGLAAGDVDVYRYGNNDPMSYVDPEGTVVQEASAASYTCKQLVTNSIKSIPKGGVSGVGAGTGTAASAVTLGTIVAGVGVVVVWTPVIKDTGTYFIERNYQCESYRINGQRVVDEVSRVTPTNPDKQLKCDAKYQALAHKGYNPCEVYNYRKECGNWRCEPMKNENEGMCPLWPKWTGER